MRAVPVLAMLVVFGALVQPGAGDDADPFEDNEDGWTGAEDEKGAGGQRVTEVTEAFQGKIVFELCTG
jgi:hypothetical protein